MPDYYRWTQWIFLPAVSARTGLSNTQWQWWCPTCQTTLSNHEAQDGVCWRGHGGLTKKQIPAWYFKITDYADQLLEGLNEIDWPERIKLMQENWIGRRRAPGIDFKTDSGVALAGLHHSAGHRLRRHLHGDRAGASGWTSWLRLDQRDGGRTRTPSGLRPSARSTASRPDREKTGVFTGSDAINPLNGENVQLWVGDYVLGSYGTGVVMGVPAHDTRDFAFAKKHGIPIKPVIAPPNWNGAEFAEAYVGPGDDDQLRSLRRDVHPRRLEEAVGAGACGAGGRSGLRRRGDGPADRQRQSERHPRGHRLGRRARAGREEHPVPHARLADLAPALLGRAHPDRLLSGPRRSSRCPRISCRCGCRRWSTSRRTARAARRWRAPRIGSRRPARSVVVLPSARPTPWAASPARPGTSCASPVRYDSRGLSIRRRLRYWMPVDLYVGGAEHAVLHLLYARFWTRVVHDTGVVPFAEPFPRAAEPGQLGRLHPAPSGDESGRDRAWIPITPEEAATLPPDQVDYRAAKHVEVAPKRDHPGRHGRQLRCR